MSSWPICRILNRPRRNYLGQTGPPALDRDEPSPTFLKSNPRGDGEATDKVPVRARHDQMESFDR
jgi:hypothetical protein